MAEKHRYRTVAATISNNHRFLYQLWSHSNWVRSWRRSRDRNFSTT